MHNDNIQIATLISFPFSVTSHGPIHPSSIISTILPDTEAQSSVTTEMSLIDKHLLVVMKCPFAIDEKNDIPKTIRSAQYCVGGESGREGE